MDGIYLVLTFKTPKDEMTAEVRTGPLNMLWLMAYQGNMKRGHHCV